MNLVLLNNAKREMSFSTSLLHLNIFSVFFSDHHAPLSARTSVMSEKSAGTPPFHSSPRPSFSYSYRRLSHYHSNNALPQEGERLSFTLDDTFRELDEFQDDPPLFLEENSWEGEEFERSDPTLTLLNREHFQVSRVPVHSLTCSLQGQAPKQSSRVLQGFACFLHSWFCSLCLQQLI